VSRRGGVIPAVDQVVKKSFKSNPPWKMPLRCPVCQTALIGSGKRHFCPNRKCPAQVRARLSFFAYTMGLKPLGPKTIDKLISRKLIQNPEDLYTLNPKDLKALGGFSDNKILIFHRSLEASKSRPVQVVLLALSIKGLGPETIKTLTAAGYDSIAKIKEAEASDLDALNGIGNTTANQIIEGLHPRLLQTAEALRIIGVKI
jgi:DNA ligase (NAD+)